MNIKKIEENLLFSFSRGEAFLFISFSFGRRYTQIISFPS